MGRPLSTRAIPAAPEKAAWRWGAPAGWQGCGGVRILHQGDLGSLCVMVGLGDAAVPAALHVPAAASGSVLCSSPAPLVALWRYWGNGDDLRLKSLTSKYHVCCGLLSWQHCEQMQQGMLFSLF